jgi:hypothetical protein
MKLAAAAFFILCLGYISGCTLCSTKKVACNGFDDPFFSQWFPYSQYSRLLFKNPVTQDTFSYTISNVYTSGAYEATSGGFNNYTRSCNASKELRSDNNGTADGYVDIYYSINEFFDNGPVQKSMSISFKNSSWNTGEIGASGFTSIPDSSASIITSNTNVPFENGFTYPLLLTLTNDTVVNKTSLVYRLFVAKNVGIVGFETYPSKQKWVIQ